MPPIETGPARAITAIGARLARASGGESLPGANGVAASKTSPGKQPAVSAGAAVETTEALDAGAPPVDAERVKMIREAIEAGTYPLVPTKIADAIIAAGVMLRSGK